VGVDVTCWRFAAVFVTDTEGDEGRASIVFKACWDWGRGSSDRSGALHLLRISGAPSVRYLSGSTTLVLTLVMTSSSVYTQPFSNNSLIESKTFSNDARNLVPEVVGQWNHSGILVVFEGIEEATCQCCGLCTIEVNPHHTI
jgi:hypothetical protein